MTLYSQLQSALILISTNQHCSGVVGFLRADGQELIPVYSDADGLNPACLEQTLSTWPSDSPRPKVLYTTPTGSNPTGQSCTESRKAEM
jgi:tryptophan aminotransferase